MTEREREQEAEEKTELPEVRLRKDDQGYAQLTAGDITEKHLTIVHHVMLMSWGWIGGGGRETVGGGGQNEIQN